MIGNCLENVRKNVPLVHNITNYVTVNDVANVLLACGGSPIMSDEPDDVADITSICGGLNINIGTLNKNSIEGMFIAGKKANELSHKILLDPVGAGASKLRTDTAVKLAKEIGGAKAAKELGIPEGTIHTWLKAVRTGQLNIGEGAHTPESAMSLAEELTMLRKRVKDQDKEIRRLKEENDFLEEASAFFAASRRKSLRPKE